MASVFKPPTGSFPVLLRLLDQYHDTQEPEQAKLACLELFAKLTGNILKNPDEPKYQRFKTRNGAIQKTVLSQRGSDLILLEVGFNPEVQDMEEFFVFKGTLNHLEISHERISRHTEMMRQAIAKDLSKPSAMLAAQASQKLEAIKLIDDDAARRRAKACRGKVLDPTASPSEENVARQMALLAIERRMQQSVQMEQQAPDGLD
ncbi:hypothetical protein BCR37DRAFT_379168 [Protomyces lactucae-debilis]|uniref:PUB domain-containing protein n=1 Tax=Protomyces lactucae-debilis TaxID=2754530 RepID=A0A1Y2FGX1_PROLT|nr:uncharacterized protein BCR37DRAFT_379168 [Protomyces lactucae-debilis]ORY83179.1 hypothetical protein BCR37DRAFT_379168 [Protomyces lactucae-debilis]